MHLRKSSHLCPGCLPFREVVSSTPGIGNLWTIQVRAQSEVKTFKYSQPTNHNIFSDFFFGRSVGVGPHLLSSSLPDENKMWCSQLLATGKGGICGLSQDPWGSSRRRSSYLSPCLRQFSLMRPSFHLGPLYPSVCPWKQSLCLSSSPFSLFFPSFPFMPLHILPSIWTLLFIQSQIQIPLPL